MCHARPYLGQSGSAITGAGVQLYGAWRHANMHECSAMHGTQELLPVTMNQTISSCP